VTRWWPAALLLLALAACAPRKEGTPPASPGAAVQPKKEITLSQKPAAPRAAPVAVPLEQTLPALPSPALLPEDFDLGPLADRIGGSRDERQAVAAAERFLDALETGKVAAEDLLPERREELSTSLSYYLDKGLHPLSHRLGALTLETEGGGERSAWFKVLLTGDPGSSSGELYLRLREGRWYVSDLQAGLALLGQPSKRREGKFIPSEYSGRLE